MPDSEAQIQGELMIGDEFWARIIAWCQAGGWRLHITGRGKVRLIKIR
jgi:hypothetical protein